jgi:transcriptional regulator with XRE-family HTH domain
MDNNFSEWLNEQMQKNNWSQSDFARVSGLSRQVISYYLSDKSKSPDKNAMQKIAHALKLSPITVFRKAGLLPSEGTDKVSFEDWQHLITQLTPDEEEEMRQIIEMKIERRQRSEQAERAKNFKPKKAE